MIRLARPPVPIPSLRRPGVVFQPWDCGSAKKGIFLGSDGLFRLIPGLWMGFASLCNSTEWWPHCADGACAHGRERDLLLGRRRGLRADLEEPNPALIHQARLQFSASSCPYMGFCSEAVLRWGQDSGQYLNLGPIAAPLSQVDTSILANEVKSK